MNRRSFLRTAPVAIGSAVVAVSPTVGGASSSVPVEAVPVGLAGMLTWASYDDKGMWVGLTGDQMGWLDFERGRITYSAQLNADGEYDLTLLEHIETGGE